MPNFLTFLYPLPGKIWLLIAPNTLFSFRVMATLIWILTFILPIEIILKDLNVKKEVRLGLMAIGVIIFLGHPRSLSYDMTANFWGGALFAYTTRFINRGGKVGLIVIAALSAAFVGTRFPNVVVLLPLTAIISWKVWNQSTRMRELFVSVSIFMLSFIFIYLLSYLVFVEQEGSGPDSKYISNAIIGYYFRDAKSILYYLTVLLLFSALWKLASSKFSNYGVFKILLVSAFWYFLWNDVVGTIYTWNYSLYVAAYAWYVLGVLVYLACRRKEIRWIQIGILAFSFGWVTASGSGAGLLKMIWSYSYILPIAVWYIWNTTDFSGRFLMGTLTGTLLLFATIESNYPGSYHEDDRWYRLKSEVNHPMLSGIYTTEARKKMLEEILGHIAEVRANRPEAEFVYHGRFSWIFRYVDNTTKHYNKKMKMVYDDPEETQLLEAHLDRCPPETFVLLVDGYPEWMPDIDKALVGELLQRKNYSVYSEGQGYILYMSPQSAN